MGKELNNTTWKKGRDGLDGLTKKNQAFRINTATRKIQLIIIS